MAEKHLIDRLKKKYKGRLEDSVKYLREVRKELAEFYKTDEFKELEKLPDGSFNVDFVYSMMTEIASKDGSDCIKEAIECINQGILSFEESIINDVKHAIEFDDEVCKILGEYREK